MVERGIEVSVDTEPRRTQADRSAMTKRALIDAARTLFAAEGFGAVGTERIVHRAGVTRGAMYHQFADKTELFAAVVEAVEHDISARLVAAVGTAPHDDIGAQLRAGIDAWLDSCADREVQQIVLVDGPAVLGWERWRDIGLRHGMGLVSALLDESMDAGSIPRQPVEPLAHVLVGALDEAVLFVARSEDPAVARADVRKVLHRLVLVATGV